MASGLIQRAGGNPALASASVDKALGKIPAVSAAVRRASGAGQ
jgi:ATP-dependent Clp protease ATP-binding subunit ClpB